MRSPLLLTLALLALPASAQIYSYVDERGNTVFTSQPPIGTISQEITLPPTNTLPSPPLDDYPSDTNTPAAVTQGYQELSLSGVPDGGSIRANNGNFTVTVTIEPDLAPGQQLRLLLDGEPYGEPTTATQFQLTNINRGEHNLAVAVIDSSGATVQQSATHTFTVQRIDLNSPARQKPIQPRPAP